MSEKNYIEFKHITKEFGEFKALDDVSLAIPKGAFVSLLGPSGCGKTTLMRLLAGFYEPQEGEIFIDGKKVNGLPPYKRNTPLVFQDYALFPHMTVFENISYGLKIKKVPMAERKEKVAKMLEMMDLVGREKRFPKELSGGQQQRTAIARALIMGQDIILLDEPLSNLDAKLRVDVRVELRQIQKQLKNTTIYVTHDQDEALSMSDIIAVMKEGKIEQIDTPHNIYFYPNNRFVADFVGTVNFVETSIQDQNQTSVTVAFFGEELKISNKFNFSVGQKVTATVRPESVKLDKKSTGSKHELSGRIKNSSFLGRVTRYWVESANYTFVVDDVNPDLMIGDAVFINIDASKIHLIAD